MAKQNGIPRSTRWSHLEGKLYEHVQEAMGIVLSTEVELQSEVDRLRKERDLAREEATRAREERETAILQARSEGAERVALEKDLDVLRDEAARLNAELLQALHELTAARHEIGRYKGFLCVAEDDTKAEAKARRRAEEDLIQFRSRHEQLIDKLRMSPERHRATQRDVRDFKRSESELESVSQSPHSGSYYPASSHRTQASRYTTGPGPGPGSSSTSSYRYQRPISPLLKNTSWTPPSPRKTTSQSSPQDASRVHIERVSPTKPQSPHPTYTHLRTSAKITAIVPVHHIKEEEEEVSLPTFAWPLQDNRSLPVRRRRSMARIIQDEDEADYVGGSEEEGHLSRNSVRILDESEDEIAIGHASDDGTYGPRPVKSITARKRKALTMLGSSRRKVKR